MDNKVLFRKAFQGFNKDDVVSYIEKISKDTGRMLAEKDAQIKELTLRTEECEKKASELESRCGELNEEASQKDAQINSLNEKNIQLEKQLCENTACADKENAGDYAALEEKYKNLCAEKASLEKQLEIYKEFESVQRDLGTIIMKAEKNAAEITAKAKSEADSILSEAVRVSAEVTDRKIKACRQIAEVFDKSKAGIDETHHTICEKLDTIKRAVDEFYSSLEAGRKIVHENVDAVTDINSTINDIEDNKH